MRSTVAAEWAAAPPTPTLPRKGGGGKLFATDKISPSPLAGEGRGGGCRGVSHLLVVLLIAATLAACAKRSDPAPPKDQVNTYPRPYPSE
jgi:hypothetical protein